MTTTIMCWRGRENDRENSASKQVASSRHSSPWLHRLDQEEETESNVETSQYLSPIHVSRDIVSPQRIKSPSPFRESSPANMDGLKTLRPHGPGDPPSSPSSFNINNMVAESVARKNIDYNSNIHSRPNSSGKMLQLTPLWEQVVKNQRVPPEINKEIVFSELTVRLRDLEWQVRQHALRVLVDLIPVLDTKAGELDMYMKPVMLSEVVNNLGHTAPAVRKGALDVLRVYLRHSTDPESVIRSIVSHGLDRTTIPGSEQGNIAMGVILCTPTLLFPLVSSQTGTIISQDGLIYLLNALCKKLMQVSFQEQVLKSMAKIRDMVGDSRFNRFLEGFHPQCRKDFDILCQVYDIQTSLGDSGIDLQLPPSVDDNQLLKDTSEDLMDNGYGYWSEDSSVLSPPEPKKYFPQSHDSNTVLNFSVDYNKRLSPCQEVQKADNNGDDGEMDDEGVSQEYNEDEDFDSDRETSSEGNTEEDVEIRPEKKESGFEGNEHEKREEKESIEKEFYSNESQESSKDENSTNADENVLQSGRVILETEIKFNEETAITMTILEEDSSRIKRENSTDSAGGNEDQYDKDEDSSEELLSEVYNNEFVMKVLTDDDDYYCDEEADIEHVRRTPRRVRFGGEMVMMRTPDSDSANEDVLIVTTSTSAEDDTTTTLTETSADFSSSNDASTDSKIKNPPQIKIETVTEDSSKKARISQIPLPISPARNPPKESKRKGPVFRRQKKTERPPSATDDADKELQVEKEIRDKNVSKLHVNNMQVHEKDGHEVSENKTVLESKNTIKSEKQTQIQVSPNRKVKNSKGNTNMSSKLPTPITNTSPRKQNNTLQEESTAKPQNLVSLGNIESVESFTSSSSDSDYFRNTEARTMLGEDKKNYSMKGEVGRNWEEQGIVSWSVLNDIYNKDDWCVRVRGIEQLNISLHQPENLNRLQTCIPSLLHCLLVTLAEDRNYKVATSAISVVRSLISLLQKSVLRQHLSQIVTGLVRHVGGNGCVNIKIEAAQAAKTLMQAVRPGHVMEILLNNNCITAKSSKMRENSLLFVIYAINTFPSTEFDWEPIAEKVVQAVTDSRRRVRQAALDALACLAQYVAPRILDRNIFEAAERQRIPEQRTAFMNAIQSRLARRQLPVISQDGLVLYALQIPPSRCNNNKAVLTGSPTGPDVDWILAGSGSVSSGSARSRGQLIAAQRMEQSSNTFSSSDASVFLGRQRESIGSNNVGSIRTGNPWTDRRAQELVAVGVGMPHPVSTLPRVQSAVDPHGRNSNNQVTWALVPVSTVPQNMEEQRQRVPPLWASDIQEVGPNGTYRPVYLRFHTGPNDGYNPAEKGFTYAPQSSHSRKSRSGNGVPYESLNQTWPLASYTTSASAHGRNPSPRVLTPSQHRGRRILEPINNPHTSIRDTSPGISEDTLPRLITPAPVRSAAHSGIRRKIPPLTPQKGDYEETSGPTEPLKPIVQEETEEYLRRSSRHSSRSQHAEKVSGKQKNKRRQRMRAAEEGRGEIIEGNGNRENYKAEDMYKPSNSSPVKHKPTPPILVDSAPGTDCTIPQKPVIVRQNLRHEIQQGGRPTSGGLFTPPAEPFLPPVEPDRSNTPSRNHYSPVHHPQHQDELDFRSLEDTDQVETSNSNYQHKKLESQVFGNPIPYSKSYGVLEAEERAHKYQQLKVQEDGPVSPQMPVSAPAAIETLPNESSNHNNAVTRTEIIDLSSTDLTKTSTTSIEDDFNTTNTMSNTSQSSVDNDEPIKVKTLAATPPHIIDLQLNVNENNTNREEDLMVSGAPLKRTRKNVDTKGFGGKAYGKGLNGVMTRESLKSRGGQQKNNSTSMFHESLRPVEKPREALQQCFLQLDSQEWEVVMQGLQTLVRLVRHHPEVVQSQQHSVLVSLARQVRNLRSQVSRAACQAAGELFLALRRSLESDLDEIATPLFHRSADTNKFLRADCNAALDKMVEVISPSRAVTAVATKGAVHQNAIVRTAASRLLVSIVSRLGVERTMSLPRETRDKIILTGANLLMEGSLETRSYAKQLFRSLSQHPHFSAVINEVIPPHVLRHITKTLQSLKCRQ